MGTPDSEDDGAPISTPDSQSDCTPMGTPMGTQMGPPDSKMRVPHQDDEATVMEEVEKMVFLRYPSNVNAFSSR